jgi:hypothetical protein
MSIDATGMAKTGLTWTTRRNDGSGRRRMPRVVGAGPFR